MTEVDTISRKVQYKTQINDKVLLFYKEQKVSYISINGSHANRSTCACFLLHVTKTEHLIKCLSFE